ncbi:DUF5316 family protein [Fictibacillus barbaricus]|uniref:Major facilitator superfamily (MFS) profile domain-containing protein n=1 Tax=Fictibacillus barbaricus TaxID=182136 RepID=A0ABU1U4M3_9BACL|nr:DUF5316 family protein [Fictibacillus barbaricus]MDR7074434.1 hypothetical protein [Fictibacillus barbaricus]
MISCLGIGIGYFAGWQITILSCGIIGIGTLIIYGLLENVFVSGNQARTNFLIEQPEDPKKKWQISSRLFIIGFPNLITAITLLLITR